MFNPISHGVYQDPLSHTKYFLAYFWLFLYTYQFCYSSGPPIQVDRSLALTLRIWGPLVINLKTKINLYFGSEVLHYLILHALLKGLIVLLRFIRCLKPLWNLKKNQKKSSICISISKQLCKIHISSFFVRTIFSFLYQSCQEMYYVFIEPFM